jgi:hypothetical protein
MGLAPGHGCPAPVPLSGKWDWLRVTDARCLSHFQSMEAEMLIQGRNGAVELMVLWPMRN